MAAGAYRDQDVLDDVGTPDDAALDVGTETPKEGAELLAARLEHVEVVWVVGES
jgi:hypothetical protein